ncbi:type IV toxin-antitoxin system AbiEi family antitoxin domain-containing protein [Nocardioides jejuensis]|nr:type IV toxin-antitoxin system AbiEi family antitoxin domain-containing protein [Nocardioides jejuensis]
MPRPQRKALPYDARAVARLLERQCGLASRRQLAALGVTDPDLRRAVRRRRLFALGSGVYIDSSSPPTDLQRV